MPETETHLIDRQCWDNWMSGAERPAEFPPASRIGMCCNCLVTGPVVEVRIGAPAACPGHEDEKPMRLTLQDWATAAVTAWYLWRDLSDLDGAVEVDQAMSDLADYLEENPHA